MQESPGQRLCVALEAERPLQVVGVPNAFTALLAKELGFKVLYLSGAAVANLAHARPDTGKTSWQEVVEEAKRITRAVDLPLIVDLDTGFGEEISRAIQALEATGAAAVQIEDQVADKRCGHLPGKETVSCEEMVKRIEAAVAARKDPTFVIIARTDAFALEGLGEAIDRSLAYLEAGADFLFPEALPTLEDFNSFKNATEAPVIANLTEFGVTPLFTTEQLAEAEIDIALYPLSISRVMNQTALEALKVIREEGTQKNLLDRMLTRKELYAILNYHPGEHV